MFFGVRQLDTLFYGYENYFGEHFIHLILEVRVYNIAFVDQLKISDINYSNYNFMIYFNKLNMNCYYQKMSR